MTLTIDFKYKQKRNTQKFINVSQANYAEIVSFIENNTMEDILSIIDLGTIALNNVRERNEISINKNLKEIIANKEKSLESNYDKKLKELIETHGTQQELLQNKINKLKLIIEQNDEHEKKLLNKQRVDLEQLFNSKIEMANDTIKQLQHNIEDSNNKNDSLREKMTNIRNEERQFYQNQLSELKVDVEKEKEILRNEKDKLNEKLDECHSQLNLLNNSNRKGKKGEKILYDELIQCFPCERVEDTSGKASKGDIILYKDGIPILIESKAYSNNVPTKEINKFIRDVEHNDMIKGGVFFSLYSGVCNKKNFTVDMIKGKPHIYIHKAAENLKIYIKIAVNIITQITNQDITLTNPVVEEIVNMNKIIKDTITQIRSYKKTINDRVKEDEKWLDNIIDNELKRMISTFKLLTDNKI